MRLSKELTQYKLCMFSTYDFYKTRIKFNLFFYIPTHLLMMQLIFLLILNQQLFRFRDLHRNKIACTKQPSKNNDAKTTQQGM